MRGTKTITISAAVIINEGAMLVVRKAGTNVFIQPGGKIERGESPEIALARELAEELSLAVSASDIRYLANLSAPAANEENAIVEASLFHVATNGASLVPCAEIVELRWISLFQDPGRRLAALTETAILPLVRDLVRDGIL